MNETIKTASETFGKELVKILENPDGLQTEDYHGFMAGELY
ncbi:MAG: hypothetical protein V4544_06915 [Pseudomonadota bacterium]